VRDERPAPQAPPEKHARLLSAFGDAVISGDISRLASLLREDAIAITDGGGRKPAALNPIIGPEKIARLFISLATKNAGRDLRLVPSVINGSIGALLYLDGEIDHTLSMAIDGDRIAAIYLVRKPGQASPRRRCAPISVDAPAISRRKPTAVRRKTSPDSRSRNPASPYAIQACGRRYAGSAPRSETRSARRARAAPWA